MEAPRPNGSTPAWLDRLDRALAQDRLLEHARALRAEGVPLVRVALILCVFADRELRARGRAADAGRTLAAAPAILEELGCPVARFEAAVRERRLEPLVLAMHDQEGWSKARLLSALKSYSVLLTSQGRDDEAVLAVLDRLTGFARDRQLWADEVDD